MKLLLKICEKYYVNFKYNGRHTHSSFGYLLLKKQQVEGNIQRVLLTTFSNCPRLILMEEEYERCFSSYHFRPNSLEDTGNRIYLKWHFFNKGLNKIQVTV